MEQKQRFFIYDRKEMGVLFLLGIMVAVFAFTLGVHLGKRVLPKEAAPAAHAPTAHAPTAHAPTGHGEEPPSAESVPTVADTVPGRQELTEQARGAQQAADESLGQALKDEVGRTGIKLDNPRQLELPQQPRSAAKPASGAPPAPHDLPAANTSLQDSAASHRPAPAGKFTLQVGSFPVFEEARDQAESLEALGLKPFMRPADIRGKRWYRIYLGGFPTRDTAEKAGARYLARHMIEAYVVSKMVDR